MYFFLNYTTNIAGEKKVHNDKFKNISEVRSNFLKVSSAVKNSTKDNSTVLNYFRVFDQTTYELKFDCIELSAIDTYISTEYMRMVQTTRTLYKLIVRGCDANTDYKEHKMLQNSSEYKTLIEIFNFCNDSGKNEWVDLSVGMHPDFDMGYGVEIYNYGKLQESSSWEKFTSDNEVLFRALKVRQNADY